MIVAWRLAFAAALLASSLRGVLCQSDEDEEDDGEEDVEPEVDQYDGVAPEHFLKNVDRNEDGKASLDEIADLFMGKLDATPEKHQEDMLEKLGRDFDRA